MRSLLCGALAAGLMVCAAAMPAATTVQKKKTSPKSATRRSTGAASNHSAVAKRTGKKGTTTARTTWRNRQLAPTPERYREIQQALVAKGYLKAEDATGGWNQNSLDALKKFQADQNIESTGKINSLSLIALGLGPKRDTASAKPVTEPAQTDR
jgi:Putative peptidoglycan binding domain